MKLNPEAFEKAAVRIENGKDGFACHALASVMSLVHDYDEIYAKEYIDFIFSVFEPSDSIGDIIWSHSRCIDECGDGDQDWLLMRSARTIGLLLCAELVRSGLTIEDFQP